MAHFVISLDNVRMFGRIGVFDQEREIGNEFVLNVRVRTDADSLCDDKVSNTVSYADIYNEVKEVMAMPHLLLETVVREIGRKLCTRWPEIMSGEISITKSVPPIAGFDGSASVTYFF
ncbi:MAG: dihydroneopterin aldolase [Muribaculaceae bacterium]|nr:dihydroneopterin aldolase [Muribaculaceae bacterium]